MVITKFLFNDDSKYEGYEGWQLKTLSFLNLVEIILVFIMRRLCSLQCSPIFQSVRKGVTRE